MNILWLAPINYVDENNNHPAPWVITLAKGIIDSGHKLTIINYNSNIKQNTVEVDYHAIKFIYIKTPKLKLDFITLYQLRINRVRKYLKKIINDYDLLHMHGTEHQYEAMADGLNIPKVISIQGIMQEYIKYIPRSNYKQFLEWNLSAYYETKYLKKNYNYSCRTHWDSSYIKSKNSKAKIYMIWEMIREEFFYDNFSLKKENILFVGGKNPIKGLKELLHAYNNSLQTLGLKLIILGNCSVDDIQKLIESQNLENINLANIDCRGMQNSKGMIKAYKESFCLVHPTYIDNSPNSICEAQLSGVPVIATKVGGVASLIKNKENGLLINRDSSDIERAVKLLLDDNELRDTISLNSRQIARERHNPKNILDQTLFMYNEIKNKDYLL